MPEGQQVRTDPREIAPAKNLKSGITPTEKRVANCALMKYAQIQSQSQKTAFPSSAFARAYSARPVQAPDYLFPNRRAAPAVSFAAMPPGFSR